MEIKTAIVTRHSPAVINAGMNNDTLAWILDRLLGQIPVCSKNIDAWNTLMSAAVPAYRTRPNDDETTTDEAYIIDAFEKEWNGREVGGSFQKTVRKLEDLFPFTELEAGILAAIHFFHTNKKLYELLDGFTGINLLMEMSRLLFNVQGQDVLDAIGEKGSLFTLGFFVLLDFTDLPYLNPILREYVESTEQKLVTSRLFSLPPASGLARNPAAGEKGTDTEKTLSFLLETRNPAIARISKPRDNDAVAVWLQTLVREYGRECRLHVPSNQWVHPENPNVGMVEFLMAWRFAEAEDCLLIVSEQSGFYSPIRNMGEPKRRAFKRFSGQKSPVFWILNDDPELDIADNLSFDFTVDLTASLKARESATLAHEVHRAAELIRCDEEETTRVVRRLGGQGADLAAVLPHLAAEQPADLFTTLLKGRIACRPGTNPAPAISMPSSRYDASALNTDIPVGNLITSLQRHIGGDTDSALGILLWGPPGTGKTAFASYLAAQSNRELMVKRYSDLQESLVGMGEKRVHEAFAEAQDGNKMFLLDEADSLLRDRSRAYMSWEVSMTNEILTSLDAFRGVFVACTNRLDDLDEAALRRFAWKIAFKPLKTDRYPGMFRHYFPQRPLGTAAVQMLADVRDLTPGDFEAVRRKVTLYDKLPKTNELVDLLRSEASYRDRGPKRAVGF